MKKFVIGALLAGAGVALCCWIKKCRKKDRFLEGLAWDDEEDADGDWEC